MHHAFPLSRLRRKPERGRRVFRCSENCTGLAECTLSRKVSDEFTVPLCRGHHREVHRSGDEAGWWGNTGVDPTVAARALWLGSPSAAGGPGRADVEPRSGVRAAPAYTIVTVGTPQAMNEYRRRLNARKLSSAFFLSSYYSSAF
jgi:hypothetical protein